MVSREEVISAWNGGNTSLFRNEGSVSINVDSQEGVKPHCWVTPALRRGADGRLI